jgi:hypothetical protein
MLALKKNSKLPLGGMLAAAGLICAPLVAGSLGVPGSINYVEGQVSLDGQSLTPRTIGSAQIEPGHVLETKLGKAEVLLTPGVFLRIGQNSAVRMVSPALSDTRVELLRGEGMLEVAELFKDNHLTVLDHGASTLIEKPGLYAFNADNPRLSVFDGEALASNQDKQIKVKKGKEAALAGILHAQSFDRNHQDELYSWSRLRSEYAAQAGAEYAQTVVVAGGPWWGPGWYWDPWWGMYSYVPGGYGVLYSPFGWGFYSPFAIYPGVGFVHGRFVGGGFAHAPVAAFRGGGAAVRPSFGGGFRGGMGAGGGRR